MQWYVAMAALLGLALAAPANAQYCREFTQRILIGGKFQQGYGTSCLMPDGAWRITETANLREPSPVKFFYTPPPVAPVTYVQPVQYVQPVTYYSRPYYSTANTLRLSYNSGGHWHHNKRQHYRSHGRGHRHHHH